MFYHPPTCYDSVEILEFDIENFMHIHLNGTISIKWSAQKCETVLERKSTDNDNQKSMESETVIQKVPTKAHMLVQLGKK